MSDLSGRIEHHILALLSEIKEAGGQPTSIHIKVNIAWQRKRFRAEPDGSLYGVPLFLDVLRTAGPSE